MLELDAVLADRDADLSVRVATGQRVAVLGANGAGKSTLLSLVSGLARPDRGRGVLDGRVLFDVGPGRPGTWLPPYRRGVALLAQDALLFEHMSVAENVAFGPRSRGAGRAESRRLALHRLEEVGAGQFARRSPGSLSGGEAQRVALARALAAEPSLLLLDEPMSAMDVAVRQWMRRLLRRTLEGRSALIVTHDALDALMLTDHTIVIDGGRVVEHGPTKDVLARPRSAFTARLAGLNLVFGVADRGAVRAADGHRIEGLVDEEAAGGGPATRGPSGGGLAGGGPADGGRTEGGLVEGATAAAVFTPRAVAVFRERPHGSPRNAFEVEITDVLPHGDLIRVRAGELSADVLPASAAELDLVPGATAYFVVKASEVGLFAV